MAENNSSAPLKTAEGAVQRDELLQAAIDFIGTLTGMKPPPIEVAPPEVFAPFHAFVERVQAITRKPHAVAAQAAPAAVAVPDGIAGALDRMDALLQPALGLLAVGGDSATAKASRSDMAAIRAALAATPALPATEDSSAGDLAEADLSRISGGETPKPWSAAEKAGLSKALGTVFREQAEVQAEPVAWAVAYNDYSISFAGGLFSELGAYEYAKHVGGTARAVPLFAAPQAQPADAAIAEKAAKYDRLVPYLCKTCSGFGIVGGHCQDGSFDSQPCPDCNQPTHTLTQAVLDVLAERARQINVEGWTPEHDDEHRDGSLSIAAACYALTGLAGSRPGALSPHYLAAWVGWGEGWFKPSSRRRNLEKAIALLIADMERLDRAAMAAAQEGRRA